MSQVAFGATPEASTFSKRPPGYKLNSNPVLSCERVECEDMAPTIEEARGGIVAIMRVVAGRAVIVTAERADGVINSVPWRFIKPESSQIEEATAKARARCVEWLYRRSLLGLDEKAPRR